MKALPFYLIGILTLAGCEQTKAPEQQTLVAKTDKTEQVVEKPKPAPKVLSSTAQPPTHTAPIDHRGLRDASIKTIRSQLKLIAAENSCDTSLQCKVVAAGSRACGGPSQYLIYSTKHHTEEKVSKLAKELTQYESQYNAENKMISICQHLVKPSTQCIQQKCVKLSKNSQPVY